MLLDIIDEMHLLQPSSNLQLSRKTPDVILKHTLEVVRKGYGFPSIFNADAVVEEQIRQGKTFEDARAGGCSGCVEVGAFGKEAYILTGYFNLAKVLELALHNGVDPRTGLTIGPATGKPDQFSTFDQLFAAFDSQLRHLVDIKIRGNQIIERLYATEMPAPFLSVLIDDCIATAVTTTPVALATTIISSRPWASGRSATAWQPSSDWCLRSRRLGWVNSSRSWRPISRATSRCAGG